MYEQTAEVAFLATLTGITDAMHTGFALWTQRAEETPWWRFSQRRFAVRQAQMFGTLYLSISDYKDNQERIMAEEQLGREATSN